MNWKEPITYAVKHKDEETRVKSRSGGIFTALTDKIFEQNGIVYGCVLNENFDAVHIRATTAEKRNLMRGSKYIQSKMGDIFKQVKIDLDSGKKVLFSGTSCQIAGLQGFLGKEYKNLLSVDIVCHGVPSVEVWQAYLKWQEEKNNSKVVKVDFRNKMDFGWGDHVETLMLSNGQKINSRVFSMLFSRRSALRPSCYECPFKSTMHPGDITIADYWGIDNAAPGFNDNKGVSLVLVNSGKGNEYFECVKNMVIWKMTKIEDSMQPSLIAPFPRPKERTKFWNDFNNKSFEYIAKKYGGIGTKDKLKRKIKRLIKAFS